MCTLLNDDSMIRCHKKKKKMIADATVSLCNRLRTLNVPQDLNAMYAVVVFYITDAACVTCIEGDSVENGRYLT